jgi:hypothetical protein
VLAGAYAAYDEIAAELERQHAVNYFTIFIPRLALALIIGALVFYRELDGMPEHQIRATIVQALNEAK